MEPKIGTIIHGTFRPEDLMPAFAEALSIYDVKKRYADLIQEAYDFTNWEDDSVNYLMDELFTALDSYSPDGCYFGPNYGDGSDFGFWEID